MVKGAAAGESYIAAKKSYLMGWNTETPRAAKKGYETEEPLVSVLWRRFRSLLCWGLSCTLVICILKLSAEFKVFPQGLSNGIDRFNMCLNSTLVCRFIFTLITMIPSPIMNRFNVCLNNTLLFSTIFTLITIMHLTIMDSFNVFLKSVFFECLQLEE